MTMMVKVLRQSQSTLLACIAGKEIWWKQKPWQCCYFARHSELHFPQQIKEKRVDAGFTSEKKKNGYCDLIMFLQHSFLFFVRWKWKTMKTLKLPLKIKIKTFMIFYDFENFFKVLDATKCLYYSKPCFAYSQCYIVLFICHKKLSLL